MLLYTIFHIPKKKKNISKLEGQISRPKSIVIFAQNNNRAVNRFLLVAVA